MPIRSWLDCPGHRALRKGRRSIPGQVYLLTTVTRDRRQYFAQWPCAIAVARLVTEKQLWRGSEPQCWVLMPDHLHVLVRLGDKEPLDRLIKRVKSVTARTVNRHLNEKGSVWAAAYHEHALRDEDGLLDMARYVIANPVRAGLVSRVGAYPFWDAIWLPR